MSNVIGQYVRSKERFQVVSGGSEVTIQFQSDPDDSSFISSQGFVIHYRGKWARSSTGEGEVLKDMRGLPIYCLQRLSPMTPVPPSPELSLVGSLHPTPPTSEAACWPISANRGMTSVALTLWPVNGTCPGAAVHLHVLKVGSNIDVISNSCYLINFYQPLRFMSCWCKELLWYLYYIHILFNFLQNPPAH